MSIFVLVVVAFLLILAAFFVFHVAGTFGAGAGANWPSVGVARASAGASADSRVLVGVRAVYVALRHW